MGSTHRTFRRAGTGGARGHSCPRSCWCGAEGSADSDPPSMNCAGRVRNGRFPPGFYPRTHAILDPKSCSSMWRISIHPLGRLLAVWPPKTSSEHFSPVAGTLRGSRKALVIDKCKACNLTGVQSNCLKVCPFPGD